MILSDFITETNYNLKGVDDSAPAQGDDDWNQWVNYANRKKDEMYDDSKRRWRSAFKEAKIGTIVAGYNTFNLTGTNADGVDLSTFMYPGKRAYILNLDGITRTYLDIVTPQNARQYDKQIYIAGANPKVVTFSYSIATGDQTIGGTLYIPGYFRPANIDPTNPNAVIPVDDPHWLSMAVAAQIAFNDITYDDKFSDLNGQANILYAQMSHRNKTIIPGEAQPSRTVVNRIRGFR